MRRRKIFVALMLFTASCVAATTEVPGSDGPTSTGNRSDQRSTRGAATREYPVDDGNYDFAFVDADAEDFEVQTDALGISLLSTVLLDRSDRYNCRGAENKLALLRIYLSLAELQAMWGEDIEEAGYPTCSLLNKEWLEKHLQKRGQEVDESDLTLEAQHEEVQRLAAEVESGELGGAELVDVLFELFDSAPCTLQRANRVIDGELVEGPRVIDLITPDWATIDIDEPAGFPNGRHPTDQVTDFTVAYGLVDLGDEVTLDEVVMNPPENDVPFRDEFPYLGEAHTELPERCYYGECASLPQTGSDAPSD